MKDANNLVHVGLQAKSIVARLQASSRELSTVVERNCLKCGDDGYIDTGKGFRACDCKRSNPEQKPKGAFSRRGNND